MYWYDQNQGRCVRFLEVVQDLIWPPAVLARQSVVRKFYDFTLVQKYLKLKSYCIEK